MRTFLLTLFLAVNALSIHGQQLHQRLDAAYDAFCEPSITERRFTQAEIAPLIRDLPAPFRVSVAGQSIEGRDIFRVEYGDGPVKVLLWSQMHGDESTATMALLDIFNFLRLSGGEFDELRARLRNDLTLVFLPMLNPDGAERFQRRNALDIDLNRDAARLVCPESQLLKRVRDELSADWGFNLHDQSRYYSAGMNPKTATISFLAPAFNYEKDINEVRDRAMRLIGLMNGVLQAYIPGKVARYDDAFEPRAFGDNITRWGTSTILIESGGLAGDPEKQQIRKLNFVALLTALDAIAARRYQQVARDAYWQIPENDYNAFHDLILREVQIERNRRWYKVDIAIRREEAPYNKNQSFYYRARITDQGDLSVHYAYDEFNGRGYRAVPGREYSQLVAGPDALFRLDPVGLLRQGITDVRVSGVKRWQYDELPLRILGADDRRDTEINLGRQTSLLLQQEGRTRYVVINGRVFDVEDEAGIRRAWKR